MVVHRKKKNRKFRGSTTHGWGSRKKHRGAGSRGGRGRAGSGKRAGHKKQHYTLGALGFLPRRGKTQQRVINVGYLTIQRLEHLLGEKKVSKEGKMYVVDLVSLGYGKLLGMGKISVPLKITISSWSAQAEEKVKAAGGEIVSSKRGAKKEEN